MPIYSFRCDDCNEVTDVFASVRDVPERAVCEQCGSGRTHRIISRVAYHASEATKTSKLDPRYDRMVDQAMKKSASADETRLIRRLKPFSSDSGKK